MITRDGLRQAALSLPQTEEGETWGEIIFRVQGKIFATLSASGQEASVKASIEQQEILLATDEQTFTKSPYTGRFGWTTVDLSKVNADLMRELIFEAWRLTAPRNLVASYTTRRSSR